MLEGMVATISADIVRSTSLDTRDLIRLRNEIRDFLERLEPDYPGFWSRIVRGDTIECVVPESKYSLRIALLLKLFVKMRVAQMECADLLLRHGIRFSIGMAELRYESRREDIINGPAIYLSGRNLDEISRRGEAFSVIEMGAGSPDFNSFLNSYVALATDLAGSCSAKQSEVVFYKLQGYKEREIAEFLGIIQSAVNIRSTNAQWSLLRAAVRDFENLNFERLCG